MKLVKRNTDYAVRALGYIASRNKKMVSVDELVKALGVPRPFLRKILQTLNKRKVITSYKGRGGGFKLAQEPADVLFLDIIKIFQGQVKITECFVSKQVCREIKQCRLRKRLDTIEKMVLSELETITIASIM